MLKGFRDFLLRGNVVDLAVAVIVGAAFNNIVNALVKDLFTPLLGILGGTPDFSNLIFTVSGSKLLVGDFLNALISFLIIATVVYLFIVAPMNALMARLKGNQKAPPAEKTCPECLSTIPLKAHRCKYCTAILKS